MSGGKLKKLYVYDYSAPKEVIVDSFTANDWGDFLLIRFDPNQMNADALEQGKHAFSSLKKKIIFVPNDLELSFYGVEVFEEEKEIAQLTSADEQVN